MSHAAGRADYDQLVDFKGLAEGEPYFMLRGQDALAGDTIRAWAMLAGQQQVPLPVLEQALRQADRLDAWPAKKLPDADHIAEAEQRQLVYCLDRRAWNAREDVLDVRFYLAERRGYAQAVAELQPVRRQLERTLAAARTGLLGEARQALRDAEAAIAASHATDDPEAALRFRDAAHAANGRAEGLARAHAALAETAPH
jgi:hypothetical protein